MGPDRIKGEPPESANHASGGLDMIPALLLLLAALVAPRSTASGQAVSTCPGAPGCPSDRQPPGQSFAVIRSEVAGVELVTVVPLGPPRRESVGSYLPAPRLAPPPAPTPRWRR